MKVSEIVLPKKLTSDGLRARRQNDIGLLKTRIQVYADKLASPDTSKKYAEFLRDRILSDSKQLAALAESKKLSEAVHRLPLTEADFDRLKEVMERPIPVVVAHIYLQDLIDDDELTGQFASLENDDPASDARALIADWVKRVMPDQLFRFYGTPRDSEYGELSPIHGYNQDAYRGTKRTANKFTQ